MRAETEKKSNNRFPLIFLLLFITIGGAIGLAVFLPKLKADKQTDKVIEDTLKVEQENVVVEDTSSTQEETTTQTEEENQQQEETAQNEEQTQEKVEEKKEVVAQKEQKIDKQTQKVEAKKEEVVEEFIIPDSDPTPKGGYPAMYEYIRKNLNYPQKAIEKEIQGQVHVKFKVLKDGSIGEAKVIKSIGGGCDEEALRVIRTGPKWTPAQHKGKAIDYDTVLPVAFKISHVTKEK